MNSKQTSWDLHYTRIKSVLTYPDENLVRMLVPYINENQNTFLSAVDLGCGSGRHMKLLHELQVTFIIGLDNALNACKLCTHYYHYPVIQGENQSLPFKSCAFNLALCWGGLHYSSKEMLPLQVQEIHRIIKPGGVFLGTLRSSSDTMLQQGTHLGNNNWKTDLSDIESSIVSFYSESELQKTFTGFSDFSYGIMERSPLGNTSQKISHWYFKAKK